MLRLTIAFLVLLVFSAAAFDKDTPSNMTDVYSSTQAPTNVSLRQ